VPATASPSPSPFLGGGSDGEGPRPRIFRGVGGPGDVPNDAGIIGTNILLAAITLALLVLSAEIFNKTVEENDADFKRWFRFVVVPVEAVSAKVHEWAGSGAGLFGAPLAILAVGALVYGLAEPGFGFNEKSAVLLVSVLVALFVLTYFYEGAQILYGKRLGIGGAIKLFPVGIAFALISVALTRLDDFQPLVIYGFIANAVVVGAVQPTREQGGKIVFFPTLALLALCLVAFLLLDPFRDLSEGSGSWIAAVPEAAAVGVFVGALEGTFFQMIPLRYLDGHKLWQWNKLAWFGTAGLTAFAVWQILLNRERDNISVISHGAPEVALIAMAVCLCLTLALYAFFRMKNARASA
jgi:hypothetical protein